VRVAIIPVKFFFPFPQDILKFFQSLRKNAVSKPLQELLPVFFGFEVLFAILDDIHANMPEANHRFRV
jgi:hypothetical protein